MDNLTRAAWESWNRFQTITVRGVSIPAPYFINFFALELGTFLKNNQVTTKVLNAFSIALQKGTLEYGAYKGKGTAAEITTAAEKIIALEVPEDGLLTPEGMCNLFQLHGLGIDCSGLVFHILSEACSSVYGSDQKLLNALNWTDPEKKTVTRASAGVFASSGIQVEKWKELQPLDLILIYNKESVPVHIAVIVPDKKGAWHMLQSSVMSSPSGCVDSLLTVSEEGHPKFHVTLAAGRDWNMLFEQGQLELRRLHLK